MSLKAANMLERGLAVLAAVCRMSRPSLADIHRETQLDKATILRLLDTLSRAGYIVKDPSDLIYTATTRTAELSRASCAMDRIAELTASLVLAFRSEVGWASDFARLDRNAMEIVATPDVGNNLLFERAPDYRPNLLLTSLGIVFLAFCDEPDLERLLAQMKDDIHPEVREILEEPDALREQFAAVRRQGFAFSHRGYSDRLYGGAMRGMAVPVMDGERVYGAVNVIVVSSAVGRAETVKRYLLPLQQLARGLMDLIAPEKPMLKVPRGTPDEDVSRPLSRSSAEPRNPHEIERLFNMRNTVSCALTPRGGVSKAAVT